MNALTKSLGTAAGSLFMLSSLLFVSCSNDGLFLSGGGDPVKMTVELSKPSFDGTRTSLNENDGNLDCVWSDGDQILVTTQSGTKLGCLTIIPDYAGKSNARFTGALVGVKDGTATLRFYYLGMKKNAEAVSGSQVYDFSSQEGTIESLSYNDLLMSSTEVSVEGGEAYTEEIGLQRQFSFARFKLIMPAGVEVAGNTVTVSGDNFFTSANLDLNGALTFTQGSAQVKIDDNDEFYMTILPEAGKAITPEFRVTVDGKTYVGSLSPREWVKSEYVRQDLGGGVYAGIPIDMREAGAGDFTDPYPEEDPRNPLHKFAKGNLYRVDGLDNRVSDDPNENGALYQWGRNYGYMDTRGIYRDNVAMSTGYAHFVDALGRFDDPDSEYDRILDYYVYNQSPNYYFMVCGTAMRYTPEHPQYSLWYDTPHFYTTKQDLIDNPTKYFMDGTPKGRFVGYGNLLIGMEVQNYNPDYWLSKFGNGGSNWEDRAKACGYAKTNPCPDGWRLPTAKEFMEIAPEGNGLDKNASLATMLSNYSELRQTADGIRYAIRWRYTSSSNAITIECVLVGDDITKASQLTTLFWDQNVNNKVVRVFPFTGMIQPLIALCDTGGFANEHIIVRPHHRGFLDYTGIPGYGSSNNYYWMLIGPADVNEGNRAFGAYWVSDKGKAFKFEAKERSNGKNTSNAIFTQTSCIFFGDAYPVNGYAIRPVMDK